jgi:methylenetetrahydrofolate reductase (NADPH)
MAHDHVAGYEFVSSFCPCDKGLPAEECAHVPPWPVLRILPAARSRRARTARRAARALAAFGPRFVSVTYGAGGSTRTATLDAARRLARLPGLRVAGHLTCVGATRAETLSVARAYAAAGLRDIVALRGDPPKGAGPVRAPSRRVCRFGRTDRRAEGDGRFPHPCRRLSRPPPRRRRCGCRHRLAEAKVRGRGGQRPDAILLRPRDVLSVPRPGGGGGIDADRIAPGILPVQNWTKVQQFAAGCGASVPPQIAQGFENAARQGNERLYALAQATQLADRLVEGGVRHLHFYTLNSAGLTRDVCRALGMRARPFLADAA